MTTSTEKPRAEKPRGHANPVDSGLDSVMQACGANLAGCVEASGNVLSGVAALNGEMFEFLSRRFEADAEASKALAQCRDVEQLRKTQSDYFSKAASDYLDQSRKLMEMSAKIAQQGMAAFRQ